jgi:RPA family protein
MLDDEDEPALVISPLSTRIENENTFVEIEIYRLEDQDFWTLEVVDELGGSIIWEDEFHSDEAAPKEALSVIEQDGLENFMLEEDEEDRTSIH